MNHLYKLENSRYLDNEELAINSGITYNEKMFDPAEAIEFIEEFKIVQLGEKFSKFEFYKSLIFSYELSFIDFIKYFKDYFQYDIEDTITMESLIEDYESELSELVYNDYDCKSYMDHLNNALGSYGYKLSTVGYSQWSYTLYPSGSRSFALDLWEGWNFYDIIQYNVLENGELEDRDSICEAYIKNTEDLKTYINDYFMHEESWKEEELIFVDNEAVQYLDVKKVKINKVVTEYVDQECNDMQ